MLPRKRQRPNPSDPSSDENSTQPSPSPNTTMPLFKPSASAAKSTPAPPQASRTHTDGEHKDGPSSLPPPTQIKSLKKTRSWYGARPLIPKAATVAQVTKETIHGGTLRPKASVDFSRYDIGRSSDTTSVRSRAGSTNIPPTEAGKGKEPESEARGNGKPATATPTPDIETTRATPPRSPSTKIPVKATPTKTPENKPDTTKKSPAKPSSPELEKKEASKKTVTRIDTKEPAPKAANPKPETKPIPVKDDDDDDDVESTTDEILSPPMPGTPVRPSTPVGWLGWLGWSEAHPAHETPNPDMKEEPVQEEVKAPEEQPVPQKEDPASTMSPTVTSPTSLAHPQPASGGWLDYWWGTSVPASADASAEDAESAPQKEEVPDTKPPMEDAVIIPSKSETQAPSAGSTWAFWSRDTGPKRSGASTPQEPGEIAVIGEQSEMEPAPADRKQIDPSSPKSVRSKKSSKKDDKKSEAKEEPKKEAPKTETSKPAGTKKLDDQVTKSKEPVDAKKSKNKRSRSDTVDSEVRPTTPMTIPSSPSADSLKSKAEPRPSTPSQTTEVGSPSKQTPANILLPDFASTYSLKENPSITRQLGRLILRSSHVHLPGTPASPVPPMPSPNQIFRTKTRPKIRRAIAIGVHGLFPSTYLRAMIGQPTGTSLRFASLCADSIRRWADANGSPDCEIEKVALEGEGKIAERVDNLWKLLLNWTEHIRQADVIILACHSQGVPVGVMLLAKLIDLGIITHARVGVCAMAGVSLGPFPYRTASMLGGSAAELLEFANPQSEIAQRYEQSLREVLAYGARITYIGSIDDQLVPLESAVHSPLHHPYIYRAVFVDGRIHAPDFIAHLIGFALKLRNLGISDHGLIRELSSPLAGSLYTGEGHSRLYFDSQVYDLSILHALETTDVPPSTKPEFRRPSSGVVGVANSNPYHLPWIMRGLLEEGRVKTELSEETASLLHKFDDWNPTTTKLKDVKYKLEAIRSHL